VSPTSRRCVNETRTLSHLLHPPLLDEVGFASAAQTALKNLRVVAELKSTFQWTCLIASSRHRNTLVPCASRISDEHSSPLRQQPRKDSCGYRRRRSQPRITDYGHGIPQESWKAQDSGKALELASRESVSDCAKSTQARSFFICRWHSLTSELAGY